MDGWTTAYWHHLVPTWWHLHPSNLTPESTSPLIPVWSSPAGVMEGPTLWHEFTSKYLICSSERVLLFSLAAAWNSRLRASQISWSAEILVFFFIDVLVWSTKNLKLFLFIFNQNKSAKYTKIYNLKLKGRMFCINVNKTWRLLGQKQQLNPQTRTSDLSFQSKPPFC